MLGNKTTDINQPGIIEPLVWLYADRLSPTIDQLVAEH